MPLLSSLIVYSGLLGSLVLGSYIGAQQSVTLSGIFGDDATKGVLAVENTGSQAALFAMKTDQPWLSAFLDDPDATDVMIRSGLSINATVRADIKNLAIGTYTGNISLTAQDIATGAAYDSKKVSVKLVVAEKIYIATPQPITTTTPTQKPSLYPSISPKILVSTPQPSLKATAGTATPKPTPSPSILLKVSSSPQAKPTISPIPTKVETFPSQEASPVPTALPNKPAVIMANKKTAAMLSFEETKKGEALLNNPLGIETSEDLQHYGSALVNTDGNIKGVSFDINAQKVEMGYKSPAKLLGILPISYTVKMKVEYESKIVTVVKPWWSFLAPSPASQLKEELEKKMEAMEEKMQTLGEDQQLAQIDLQNALQKQQQLLQTLSNVSKTMHDTALSIIRNMGG